MIKLFRKVLSRLQAIRQARVERTIGDLTFRYHLFRSILDDNNRAVELLTELDFEMRSRESATASRAKIGKLINTTGNLVENLNLLDDFRHRTLMPTHKRIVDRITAQIKTLPSDTQLPLWLHLADPHAKNQVKVGGKAAMLASIKQETELPVPDGFALTVNACREFLYHEGLILRVAAILREYETNDRQIVEQADKLQEMILKAPLPQKIQQALADGSRPFFEKGFGLAVRSSSRAEDGRRHSFAGQFATVLNVVDRAGLEEAFRIVVASSFNKRSIVYRRQAGLDPLDFNMAILCLHMLPARAAGILLTRSPLPGHSGIIISALYGLGEAAVGGRNPTDLYLLDEADRINHEKTTIAVKTEQLVCLPDGGTTIQPVEEHLQKKSVLDDQQAAILAGWGKALEDRSACPQDIEWALTPDNRLFLLQARPQVMSETPTPSAAISGAVLAQGLKASGGSATGKVHIVKRRADLEEIPDGPTILILDQSLVDAVSVIDQIDGILVAVGNPTDHLALVARENLVPMVCGLGDDVQQFQEKQWLTLDGDRGIVTEANQKSIEKALKHRKKPVPSAARSISDETTKTIRALIIPLNLTDAFGPTFSIAECRSLHDIIRYVHEKAVLAMFHAGDSALEHGGIAARVVEADVPFLVNVIDLGGGLVPGTKHPRRISPESIRSVPFLALWKGVSTPDLYWGPPGSVNMGSVMSSWLTDHRSARPVGMPNYAIITKDYLNLNARMDFHFTMIDAVCGLTARSNYVKFRFKGGGTQAVQRQRRARCIAKILEAQGFFTDVRGDLVNASVHGLAAEHLTGKLAVLGRLLGFTRLLDAAMKNEEMIDRVAEAFLNEEYSLPFLKDGSNSAQPDNARDDKETGRETRQA